MMLCWQQYDFKSVSELLMSSFVSGDVVVTLGLGIPLTTRLQSYVRSAKAAPLRRRVPVSRPAAYVRFFILLQRLGDKTCLGYFCSLEIKELKQSAIVRVAVFTKQLIAVFVAYFYDTVITYIYLTVAFDVCYTFAAFYIH